MSDPVKISVIILYHDNERLSDAIKAVDRQVRAGDEIIIVDDHSIKGPDLSDLLCDDIRIIVPNVAGNRSYNRNRGAKVSINPYLLFIDGDVIICEGTIEALRKGFSDGLAVLAGQVLTQAITLEQLSLCNNRWDISEMIDADSFDSLRGMRHAADPRSDYDEYRSDNGDWCQLYSLLFGVTKDAFDGVGGFDESFADWGGEDLDLGYRLKNAGLEIWVSEGINGVHVPHPRDRIRQELDGRRSLYRMLSKYHDTDVERVISFGTSGRVKELIKIVEDRIGFIDDSVYRTGCFELELIMINGRPLLFDNRSGDEFKSFGLAIDCPDGSVKDAFISPSFFYLPEAFYCRILQELCRVSPNVYSDIPQKNWNITWAQEIENTFRYAFCYTNLLYLSNDIRDFNIIKDGDRIRISLDGKSYGLR